MHPAQPRVLRVPWGPPAAPSSQLPVPIPMPQFPHGATHCPQTGGGRTQPPNCLLIDQMEKRPYVCGKPITAHAPPKWHVLFYDITYRLGRGYEAPDKREKTKISLIPLVNIRHSWARQQHRAKLVMLIYFPSCT